MLISFLLRASAFGATRITGKLSAAAARQLLQDILDAGIVVDFPDGRMLTAVEGHIEQLEPQFKQRLLILLEEIKKQRKSIVATPASGRATTEEDLVRQLTPDVAVVPDAAASRLRVGEAVAVEDYLDSNARTRCQRIFAPQEPAGQLNDKWLGETIGHFFKYARTVTVLDKMIGRSAADGKLAHRFVHGLRFVVECWTEHSVYSNGTLELIVVTGAGDTGATRGYIDAEKARATIQAALAGIGARVKVVLKQDSSPPVFHARFLRAKGRCIKIDPGIDGLAAGGSRCSCLLIDPPSRAANAMASQIMRLSDL